MHPGNPLGTILTAELVRPRNCRQIYSRKCIVSISSRLHCLLTSVARNTAADSVKCPVSAFCVLKCSFLWSHATLEVSKKFNSIFGIWTFTFLAYSTEIAEMYLRLNEVDSDCIKTHIAQGNRPHKTMSNINKLNIGVFLLFNIINIFSLLSGFLNQNWNSCFIFCNVSLLM